MPCYVYAASFNQAGTGGGVYGFRWRARGCRLEALGVVSHDIENPLCLLASHNGEYLHVGDCTTDWRSGGAVYSHWINPASGALELIGAVDSAGLIPVYLAMADDNRNLLVANCGPFTSNNEGCTVAVLPVKAHGQLGPAKTVQRHSGASADPQRQTSPHPHCIALDPQNLYAWVPDLGTDSIWCYAYNPTLGALLHQPQRTVTLPAHSGPRFLKFHPNGRYAYLVNEIANTLVSYRYQDAQLEETGTQSTLPPGVEDRNAADLVIHQNGRNIYVSNRTAHCISVFSIERNTGTATLIEHIDTNGKVPRGMALDPTGRILLVGNEADDCIQGFRLSPAGQLRPLGCVAEMPGPASLIFVEV